jgi:pimeloyl-ACP methyl ester carboxylesterase
MALHTTTAGDPAAPTLVLLHGFGVTGWMWAEQVARLSDRFHCVVVDLPGQGRSHAEPWVSLADAADRVAEIIAERSGDGRAHVVGLSLGGYVTLALLARHPELVRSAVVTGVATRPLVRPRLRAVVTGSAVVLLRNRLVARAGAAAMRLPRDVRAVHAADLARLTPDTVRRVYAEILDHRAPDGLERSAQRLLALAGDRESRAIRGSLADLAGLGATAALAPRGSHAWLVRHPELFARTVAGWAAERSVAPELVAVPAVTAPRG